MSERIQYNTFPSMTHYTPRRSTKITLNQLLLILLTIPVQLSHVNSLFA